MRGEMLKEVMRRYPTGVTIVTSYLEGKPHGLTVNSFTSISLEPPLVGVFVKRGSAGQAAISGSKGYVVNILKHDQAHLAARFASEPPSARFRDVEWRRSPRLGFPVIAGSLAYIEAEVREEIAIADHSLFVGEVVAAEILLEEDPLIYHMRSYKTLSQPRSSQEILGP